MKGKLKKDGKESGDAERKSRECGSGYKGKFVDKVMMSRVSFYIDVGFKKSTL